MPAQAPSAETRTMSAGEAASQIGAMLAYEHSAGVRLPAEEIVPRQRAVMDACNRGMYGACVVLNVNQRSGDYPSASIALRIVPEGVEPIIALAGEGGELGERGTHAEDLAVHVRDNERMQDRLRRELERLEAFQQRPDLAVADMITLSERLAATEVKLESAEREAAQYRRRIDTHLLRLNFTTPGGYTGRGEIAQALHDFVADLTTGTAWTIRASAFLIPLAVVLAILVFALRWLLWRRRR